MSFSDQTLLAQTIRSTNFPDRIWNLVRDFPVPRPNDRNIGARIPSSQALFDFWHKRCANSQFPGHIWHKRHASSQFPDHAGIMAQTVREFPDRVARGCYEKLNANELWHERYSIDHKIRYLVVLT